MGFVMLAISTLTSFGINAAIFGMVAHGLITGMLFFIAGSVQHTFETREMSRLGGLLLQAPKMGWIATTATRCSTRFVSVGGQAACPTIGLPRSPPTHPAGYGLARTEAESPGATR